MRAILACSLSTESSHSVRLGGYTLLEMLVVLVLLALASGLIVPSLSRWYAGVQERGWYHDLKAAVEMLPLRAYTTGQALAIDAAELDRIVPGRPSTVTVQISPELAYQANGMASPAVIRIQGSRTLTWRVAPLTGEVTEE